MIRRATAATLVVLLLPWEAFAQQDSSTPRGSIYVVDPLIDGVWTAAMFGVAALIDRDKKRWGGLSPCDRLGRRPTKEELEAFEKLTDEDGVCGEESIGFFERFVAGRSASWARLMSDVLLVGMFTAPLFFAAGDVLTSDVEKPGLRFLEDATISVETHAATLLATNVLKLIVKRPRPLSYNRTRPKLERFAGDARLSFPSGHTSVSFSSATLIAYAAAARHGNSWITWVSGGLAYLSATTVAYLRMEAGKHFLSDVFAGAVIGVAAGLIFPTFHKRSPGPPSAGSDAMMLSIGTTF